MDKKDWIKATNDAAKGKSTPKQALENYYREANYIMMQHADKIVAIYGAVPTKLMKCLDNVVTALHADDCELFKIYRMLCDPKCSRRKMHDELMLFIMFFIDNDKSEAWKKYYRSPNGLDKFNK